MTVPIEQPLIAQSITELLEQRARENQNDPFLHSGEAEYGFEIKTLTFGDTLKAVDRLCHYYATLGMQPKANPGEVPPEQVVGVLTISSIDEPLLEMALCKLGLCGLLLSTNNSPAAIAHLCKTTGAKHLIYGPKFQETAKEAQQSLKEEGYALELVPEKKFPLWGPGGIADAEVKPYPALLTPEQEKRRAGVILHSSGSTGFPKPVPLPHLSVIGTASCSKPMNKFSALPLFHAFGHFCFMMCLHDAKALTQFPPHLPLTAANLVTVLNASPSKCEQMYIVPKVLEIFAETEDGRRALLSFDDVTFGGAALSDALGDRLVALGVKLASFVGSTESGPLFSSDRDFATDKNWQWLRCEGAIARYTELLPQGDGTVEVIVKAGWPGRSASNRKDGAWCTNDLYQVHPNHPTWLKYMGRLDDTLTLSLGEKTNPVPIELTLRGNSPHLHDAIVFGNGRPQCGVLLIPSPEGKKFSDDELIDKVWPVVEMANATSPSHSRIIKEMIGVLPPDAEVPRSAKNALIRPAAYKKFASIIDGIYDRFDRGNGEPRKVITTKPEMEKYLFNIVSTALGNSDGLTTDTELFSFGVNSLTSTRIRNEITKTLELSTTLHQNVVYEHPTISQLADFLLAVNSGKLEEESAEKTYDTMLKMAERWQGQVIKPVPVNEAEVEAANGQVVVLTGATGSLGAHIVDQLARRPDVAKIICLSRAKSHADSLKRIQESLQTRGRHSVDLNKIMSYAADVNKPNLGLTADEHESIRRSATAVIHNAWPVNFNYTVEVFDDHIGGMVNLINLALSSPRKVKPAFFFSSSVSTTLGVPDDVVQEDFLHDPSSAVMGYGQSKWVCERIIEHVGQEGGGRMGVFRIGQMVGDTENGIWNETESWPLMFRSANVIGALPKLNAHPDWIPVDEAARAIAEIVSATYTRADLQSPHADVYHIMNPQRAEWGDVLEGLREGGLKFEPVDMGTWLQKLAKSNPDPSVNPTYKLLPFWEQGVLDGAEHKYTFNKVSQLSPTVRNCKPVNPELVKKWTNSWIQSGFMQKAA